jgi:hypothetical protein
MKDEENTQTLFVTIKQLEKETGIKRNQIVKDIHSGRLPHIKRGHYYYIYRSDASRYIYELVCEARHVNPDEYSFLRDTDSELLEQVLKSVLGEMKENDKSKE